MKRIIFGLLVVLATAVLPSAARAQSGTTGAIAGVVRDATGAVLPGVTVEASSPALIEKVRTATTDTQGNYNIVDLRPGTYSVTFTLPGFSTFKRDGIELTTGFTATANAEMRVGAVEETVTVTGASPVVDIRNVRVQTVLTRQVLDALPVAQSMMGLGILTLGATVSFTGPGSTPIVDVGGSKGDQTSSLTMHGMRSWDQRMLIDGMSQNALTGRGSRRNYMVNQVSIEENVVATAAASVEVSTGGMQLNAVPKEGGNTFKFYFQGSYTNESLQSDNVSDEMRRRGVSAVPGVKEIYDWGVGVGGRLIRDRLWFYTAHRWWGTSEYQPGAFFNKSTSPYSYEPDLSRRGFQDTNHRDSGVRLTWQITSKHKLAFSENVQRRCACYAQVSSILAPEASYNQDIWPTLLTQGTWNYPASNRLLFEAGVSYLSVPIGVVFDQPFPGAVGIRDLATGVAYAGPQNLTGTIALTPPGEDNAQSPLQERFSVTYVKGSHALKFGQQWLDGFVKLAGDLPQHLTYQFRNGLPSTLTQWAAPLLSDIRVREIGLYAQDQWTIKRLTLNLGARYDHFTGWVPAATQPAGRFVPAFRKDRVENVPRFDDVSPRVGAAYDLFGNGKTAIKASIGRYALGLGPELANENDPAQSLVRSSTRTWNDANRNFVPDCNLTVVDANGECGALDNRLFGQTRRNTFHDASVLEGWGNRGYSWQGSVSLQQELRPGVALNVGYFRTQYGNLTVTRNELVTAADFDAYCITAPVDSRLPGGGGHQICGLYDVTRARFGQVRNLVTQASAFGKQEERFDGVDIGVNARFGRGGFLQGGVSLGRQVLDNCFQKDHPELTAEGYIAGTPRTSDYCRVTPPWSAGTQYKVSGIYPLPLDAEISFTFQNLPGWPVAANWAAPNAAIAPSLGRNLAACPATAATCTSTVVVPLIRPQTMFLDRVTQLDLRFAKAVRAAGGRVKGIFDIYNVFNASTILAVNGTYGPTWLRPTSVHGGRLLKFGAQVEF